jgi:GT2 family glycosyltransferase
MINDTPEHEDNFLISIIIVNYFSARDLSLTLNSIHKNTCYPVIDVHVVDNSNNVDEKKKLEKLHTFEHFHLHDAGKNLGFANACNLVYQKTAAPYVLLINPDAYFLPGAIDILLRKLENNPGLAATGPKIFWDDQQQFTLPQSITLTPFSFFITNYPHSFIKRILWFKSLILRRRAIKYWTSQQALLQINLSGGSVLLRRECVDRSGGLFDADFFMYFEDTDLFARLVSTGYKLLYVPEAQIVHKFSGCAREQQAIKNEYMAQSAEQFLLKHYPANYLIRLTRNAMSNAMSNRQILSRSSKPWSSKLWSPELIDFGPQNNAQEIVISLNKTSTWLIEWSPSLYFLPAAGMISTEPVFRFPQHIWDILPTGDHYLRIAPLKKFWIKPQIWHWIKD